MTDIYQMDDGFGGKLLVTPIGPGTTRESLTGVWKELEALNANGYVVCSMCGKAVAKDERGDVLDSSGRCDECRP